MLIDQPWQKSGGMMTISDADLRRLLTEAIGLRSVRVVKVDRLPGLKWKLTISDPITKTPKP